MATEVGYDEANDLVRVAYVGRCAMDDYLKGTMNVVALLRRHQTDRCLIDLRYLDNRANLEHIYELPRAYHVLEVPGTVQIAILTTEGHKDERTVRFYETVCINRGWWAKIFFDEGKALKWMGAP
jgi:hypothetical protein